MSTPGRSPWSPWQPGRRHAVEPLHIKWDPVSWGRVTTLHQSWTIVGVTEEVKFDVHPFERQTSSVEEDHHVLTCPCTALCAILWRLNDLVHLMSLDSLPKRRWSSDKKWKWSGNKFPFPFIIWSNIKSAKQTVWRGEVDNDWMNLLFDLDLDHLQERWVSGGQGGQQFWASTKRGGKERKWLISGEIFLLEDIGWDWY